MRLLQFFSLAGAALAAQHVERQEKVLTKLNLTEPLNWMASDRLFPAEVIAGNHANLSEYDEDAWVARNLEWCQTFEDCTTVSTFQGNLPRMSPCIVVLCQCLTVHHRGQLRIGWRSVLVCLRLPRRTQYSLGFYTI